MDDNILVFTESEVAGGGNTRSSGDPTQLEVKGRITRTHPAPPTPTQSQPHPSSLGQSVHIHRGERRGGDLIQDAAHVTGDVHEALLVHQDEGVFLRGRYTVCFIVSISIFFAAQETKL